MTPFTATWEQPQPAGSALPSGDSSDYEQVGAADVVLVDLNKNILLTIRGAHQLKQRRFAACRSNNCSHRTPASKLASAKRIRKLWNL